MIRITKRALFSAIQVDEQDELDWLLTVACVRSGFNPMLGTYTRTDWLVFDVNDAGLPLGYPLDSLTSPKVLLTGAIDLICAQAKDDGIDIQVDDTAWRAVLPKAISSEVKPTPRPHQREAIQVALQKGNGVLKAQIGRAHV